MTVDKNPTAGLLRQAQYFPGAVALDYEGQTWTYAELVRDIEEWAKVLEGRGVRPGDRVAYLGLNSSSFIIAMFASWWVGAIFTPLNYRLAAQEVLDLLDQAAPRLLVVEPGHRELVDHISYLPELNDIELLLVDTDPAVPLEVEVRLPWFLLSARLDKYGSREAPEFVSTGDADLAMIMFTSGTTGRPKGVELTHGNLWWNSVNVDSIVDTRRGDVNYTATPLFHIGALNALTIRAFVRGSRNVLRRQFDPGQALRDIEEHGANQAFMVPAMLKAMEARPEFADAELGSMRALICAGAPVPPAVIRSYLRKGVAVQQAWGLTETAPFATYLPTELTADKAGSCGLPMPFTDVRIVDPDTLEHVTEPGATGEMWVRGPNVTRGYWNNRLASEQSFHEGWFRSGDIGHTDEDGYLYIVDRLKDMVITGGENVYPAEVERVLMEMPGIRDIAIVGLPDEKWGEAVVAVATVEDGATLTIDEVREFADRHLARYKIPKTLIVVDDLARTPAGKLNKTEIRALARARAVAQEATA